MAKKTKDFVCDVGKKIADGLTGTFNKFKEVAQTAIEYIKDKKDIILDTLKKVGIKILDGIQFLLDLAGLIPGIGEIADAINGGIYTLRGDALNAALSFAACIPFAGWAATGGKIVGKVAKFVDKIGDVSKLVDKVKDFAKYFDKVKDLSKTVMKYGDNVINFIARKGDDIWSLISKNKVIDKAAELVSKLSKVGYDIQGYLVKQVDKVSASFGEWWMKQAQVGIVPKEVAEWINRKGSIEVLEEVGEHTIKEGAEEAGEKLVAEALENKAEKEIKEATEIASNHPIVEKIRQRTSMDTIRADANLTSFEEAFIDAMGKENMTVDEYIKLTHTPLSQLSEKDIKRIYNVNSAVANPTNDVLMSKVIPEGTYINCIENGNFSDTVGNCLTRAQDMQDCSTFNDYYNKLGLNYEGNPFDTADKMYVMRYTSPDTERLVTRSYGGCSDKDVKIAQDVLGLDAGHTFKNDPPYLGTGVTKDVENGIGKMELMTIKDIGGNAQYCKIGNNSAIYQIERGSSIEKLVAIRHKNKWWKVSEIDG